VPSPEPQRVAQLGLRARRLVQRHAVHRRVPRLPQRGDTCRDTARMAEDAAALGSTDLIFAAATRPVWPELNTGIATIGAASHSGASTARADAITLSSLSLNLLPRPLTCRWSAPASRQSCCHGA
jgi:hypothetical protein